MQRASLPLSRRLSSSALLILGLTLMGIAPGFGIGFHYLAYGTPTTDGLQNIFRLALSFLVYGVLGIMACLGLITAVYACLARLAK